MPRSVYTTPKGTTLHYVSTLGQGQYGTALEVRGARQTYCLKEVSVCTANETEKKQVAREVKLMQMATRHSNVVDFYEMWFDRNRMFILMELCPFGSLDKLIQTQATRRSFFPEQRVLHILESIASALCYCHDTLHMVHRDVKPANVLMDSIGTIKLADFGLSKCLGADALCATFAGTPLYMAPEQFQGHAYSYPADMWALGCIAYELMSLHSPWITTDTRGQHAVLGKILEEEPDFAKVARFSDALVDTTRWLLRKRPSHRARACDLLDLLSMRTPPAPESPARPPSPIVAPPTPPPPPPLAPREKGEDDMEDLIAAARRIAAADKISTSFRISRVRRKAQEAAVAPPAHRPLAPMHRLAPPPPVEPVRRAAVRPVVPAVRAAVRPRDAPPREAEAREVEQASVLAIQRGMRVSLNRRRRPAVKPPTGPCTDRVRELALPRRRMTPRAGEALPSVRGNLPRPAWM